MRARFGAMAIGPLVVSWNQDERMARALRQPQTIIESLVAARGKPADEYEWGALAFKFGARLVDPCCAVSPKIAVVHHKGQLSRVYLPHYVAEFFFRPGVVGHVSDQREFESGALSSPLLLYRGAGKEKHGA
jgi:hypothetical protein